MCVLTSIEPMLGRVAYRKYMPEIYALYGKDWNGDLPDIDPVRCKKK